MARKTCVWIPRIQDIDGCPPPAALRASAPPRRRARSAPRAAGGAPVSIETSISTRRGGRWRDICSSASASASATTSTSTSTSTTTRMSRSSILCGPDDSRLDSHIEREAGRGLAVRARSRAGSEDCLSSAGGPKARTRSEFRSDRAASTRTAFPRHAAPTARSRLSRSRLSRSRFSTPGGDGGREPSRTKTEKHTLGTGHRIRRAATLGARRKLS